MSRETSDIYTRLDITGYENSVANSMRTTDARKQSGECALVRRGSRREEARRENFTVIGPASVVSTAADNEGADRSELAAPFETRRRRAAFRPAGRIS